MKTSNRISPSQASTPNGPIDLTMDAFRPVDSMLLPRMAREPAPREDRLPYAWQDPRSAAHVAITTPGGSYESDSIHIDDEMGEIIVDADGTRILLDDRNIVVYLDSEHPTIYRNVLCDVTFTA